MNRYIIFILLLLVLLPLGAFAQMPVAPPGLVQINPPYEGAELIWSSATILAYNWYGEYRLDVVNGVVVPAPHDILSVSHGDTVVAAIVQGDLMIVDATPDWVRLPGGAVGQVLTMGVAQPAWAAAGAAGLWEAGVSYRGGAASLEPIAAQDGIPVLIQDGTAAQYLALIHDAVDANYDTSAGSHRFFMIGAGNGLRVHAPGIAPGASIVRVDILHDAAEGVVRSLTGDLQLDAVADIYTLDNFGIGTAAPTAGLDSTTDIRMRGTGPAANMTIFDDGAGTGIFDWDFPHAKDTCTFSHPSMVIPNTATAVAPVWSQIDAINTSAITGFQPMRAGSITGISINASAIGEIPATFDTVTLEVYINGVATGLNVAGLDAATTTGSTIQAIGVDVFVADDIITVAGYYVAGAGPAAIISLTDLLMFVEVHYD